MATELIHEMDIRTALETCRRIAVLGAHLDPGRPAFYVPNYLFQQGYDIFAVNPEFAGEVIWGRPVVARLGDLSEPVDMVDVFRHPNHLPDHVPELLGMVPLPRVVWMQTGVSHAEVTRDLVRANIDVVQDRCTMAEHRSLLAGSRIWS